MKRMLAVLVMFVGLLCAALPTQAAPQGILRIHFANPEGSLDGWGLHIWGDGLQLPRKVAWNSPWPASGSDSFGIYFDIPVSADAGSIGFVVHRGEEKGLRKDLYTSGNAGDVWHIKGDSRLYGSRDAAMAKLNEKRGAAESEQREQARAAAERQKAAEQQAREDARREALLKREMEAIARQADLEEKKKKEDEKKKLEEQKLKEQQDLARMAAERDQLVARLLAERNAKLQQSEAERYKQQQVKEQEDRQREAELAQKKEQAQTEEQGLTLSATEWFAVVVGGGFIGLLLLFIGFVFWQRRKLPG